MFTITKEWLDQFSIGKKRKHTKAQVEALGISYPPITGWQQRIIGKKIKQETAKKFESCLGEVTSATQKHYRKLERLNTAKALGLLSDLEKSQE